MSVTSGFFNAVKFDRLYDATQISSVFCGVIPDGILSSIGECFICEIVDENSISIGSGFGYFSGMYIYNDERYNYQILNNGTYYVIIDISKINRTLEIKIIDFENYDPNNNILLAKVIKNIDNISIENFIGHTDNDLIGPDIITGIEQKVIINELYEIADLRFSIFSPEFFNEINQEFNDFIDDNEYYLYHQEGSTQYDRFLSELNSKATKCKVLNGVLQSNTNNVSFTDPSIIDGVCLDVKMRDYTILIDNIVVDGNTATVYFKNKPSVSKNIKLIIDSNVGA